MVHAHRIPIIIALPQEVMKRCNGQRRVGLLVNEGSHRTVDVRLVGREIRSSAGIDAVGVGAESVVVVLRAQYAILANCIHKIW